MGAFKFTLDGRAHRRRAHRLWRHGGDAEARAHGRSGADRRRSRDSAEPGSRRFAALARGLQPIDDMRASAGYRLETARALLRKALIEIAGGVDARRASSASREAA